MADLQADQKIVGSLLCAIANTLDEQEADNTNVLYAVSAIAYLHAKTEMQMTDADFLRFQEMVAGWITENMKNLGAFNGL